MTGIILLAAGASSRMGQPKQQLPYKGSTLLDHAITTATQSDAGMTVVVLGSHADLLSPIVQKHNIPFTIHEQWHQGMAGSIQAGMRILLENNPLMDGIMIILCDQPRVTTALLNHLISVKATLHKGIVACSYEQAVGVPVLFDKSYFPALMALQGEAGAKRVLQEFHDDVALVNFPEGSIDIDTPEDLHWLDTL